MSFVAVPRLRSIILLTAGLVAIASSVVVFFSWLSSPAHSAVSPENDPLAIELALLAGLGWMLIGIGLGSLLRGKSRLSLTGMAMSGALFGGLIGFLAWVVIHFMFTS